MATRFWVGGGSANTWAATGNTNWATTSGGANNASVPTTTDIAVFDSNSGSSNSVIGANITVQGLECDGSTLGTGTYAGTLTHNAAVTLTINTGAANSFRLTSGMTYTAANANSIVTFTHTSGTASLKSAGKSFGGLTINGAGGTTTLVDALQVNAAANSTLTVTSGVFDAATNTVAITAIGFAFSGATTRTVSLGGTVTLGGNASGAVALLTAATTTNLTFNKNSANIIVLAPTGSPIALAFTTGALTFNNITLNATTAQCVIIITSGFTCANLTINSGWSLCISGTTTSTISNAFTWTGTQATPILVYTTAPNSVSTISCPSGSCTLSWGSIANVTATGGATFTATNTLSSGNNPGWAITPPADSSPAGIAAAVWQDATAGDFTVSGSIGKSLFTSGNAPGAASGLALVGSAVNATQIAGSTASATGLNKATNTMARGTVTTGASTTSVPTSALTIGPSGAAATGVVANQFGSRTIMFDGDTTTAGLRGATGTISASSASNTPTFTVSTLPATPVSGDTFSVV